MPTVHVEPSGAAIEVKLGEAVAVAAWRLGYWWPTTCWGQADCTLCRTEVLSGHEHVEPAGAEELHAIGVKMPAPVRRPGVRLACRLTVTGDGVTLRKDGLRPPAG